MVFQGDSDAVVRLLNKEHLPHDIWLFNAANLTLDMLHNWSVTSKWIPREQNSVCDQLARKALHADDMILDVSAGWKHLHERGWRTICAEFVRRFTLPTLYPLREQCVIRR